MVSKNQIKLITSLQQKKYRKIHQLFIAEGKKVILELLEAGFKLEFLFVTEENIFPKTYHPELISEQELKKITALTTPNNCLAVFKTQINQNHTESELILALDTIRDPGNMGTIIRLCDWFGITTLVCSEETVDSYNPKVVQATMGSLARVNLIYTNLHAYLSETNLPIYGTFMDGKSIYETQLPQKGIIVMGNEANGISKEVEDIITERIAIPRFGNLQLTESLNVATATAIILSEFKRR
ncbi:RNA methyltransferase [Flavobacterium sp. 20NA77.7]|uniref:RNA methyltransferase n=1 Tax=Flavobacterium nakdongensis TaxID=3073563 RepID=A0ABY9R8E2_9FLAO|nr:RNA methyltransferase [Flavobacterium sp. 20NA77.7]WMW77528.1 RNA methyltransferase [Flavobacterium sp. 20NA77.7]